jgi:hemerythrin
VVAAIFRQLRDTLEEHFHSEERYLRDAGYPAAAAREHLEQHRDVLFTLDHEFDTWAATARGPEYGGPMARMCIWVWHELIRADLDVKRRLDAMKQAPAEA